MAFETQQDITGVDLDVGDNVIVTPNHNSSRMRVGEIISENATSFAVRLTNGDVCTIHKDNSENRIYRID